jgi:MFS family permease
VILAVACLVGFALACAAGAKPSLLLEAPLRWTELVVAALAIQLALFAFDIRPAAPFTTSRVHLASYVLLAVFAARNVRLPGLALAAAGLASNALVISANGGRMPVAQAASADSSGTALHGMRENVVAAGASTHLAFLGDVFSVPHRFPLANTFSIGDVLLVIGFTLFVYTNGRATADRPAVRALEPLRVRTFRALLGARMVSKLGDWISTAALVTWVFAQSHSTLWVSGILLARLTASISGSLVSALVLGRHARFALLAFVEGVRALATLAAVAAVAGGILALVPACVFVSSFLASATDPTASSLVTEVLSADERHAGNALHALGRAVVMAIGSLAGGLLAANVGAVPALFADTGTFAVALVLYALMARRRALAPAARLDDGPAVGGVGRFAAFAIVCRRRRLASLVGSFTVATFAMGTLNASLPSFLAARAPHVGGYGVAIALIALGLICGEYVSGRASRRVVDRIPSLGFAATAVAAALAAASHSAATILLFLFALGVADGTTEAAYDTVVQDEAPLPAVDRVFAVAGAVQQTGMVAGFLAAPLLQSLVPHASLRPTALALAVAAALAALAIARERSEPASPVVTPDAA